MPQIRLEYSNNCKPSGSFDQCFSLVHQALQSVAGITLENCKSRAIGLEDFYIADGDSVHSFAHLSIRFVEGRPEEIRQAVGEACLEILKQCFIESIKLQKLQLTVEVQDITLSNYHKFPEGTLTPQ